MPFNLDTPQVATYKTIPIVALFEEKQEITFHMPMEMTRYTCRLEPKILTKKVDTTFLILFKGLFNLTCSFFDADSKDIIEISIGMLVFLKSLIKMHSLC